MRAALLRFLGEGTRLQSSYLPGRSGFVFTASRSLEDLRAALLVHTACRIYPLHQDTGRFFLEPTSRWLSAALSQELPWHWWNAQHQAGATMFFTPQRSDRLRRLGKVAQSSSYRCPRGFLSLRNLALRLEALPSTPRPDKHWRGLGEAFDRWWGLTPLYADPQAMLAVAVIDRLSACHQQATQASR